MPTFGVPISVKEVEEAIKRMKPVKVRGPNDITALEKDELWSNKLAQEVFQSRY